jgi:hypothetical protein
MQSKWIALALIALSTSCNTLISQKTDEEAWGEFLKESRIAEQAESRVPASNEELKIQPSVKILREILKDFPFRNYLISCDSSDCYQSKLVIAFDEVFRRVKNQDISLTTEQYKNEQKKFIEEYGYLKMMKLVESFHHILFSGVELRATSLAADLVHVCKSSLDSNEQVHISEFYPFSGGMTYLPRAYYVCLSAHWSRELDQLLKDTCERLGVIIKTEEARSWILSRQIFPIYQKTLGTIFLSLREQDLRSWQQDWEQIESRIDWNDSVDQRVSKWAPELRKKYHFLNLEALLSEAKPSKN